MCAIVIVEDFAPVAPRWDRDRVAILIGRGLDHFGMLRQVQAMLTYLGAPQTGVSATCWCGDYIEVPTAPPFPQQLTAPRQKEVGHAP
jgi:hypothetical protein